MSATAHSNDPTKPEPDFWHASSGLKSWLTTLDHKRIGFMYLFGILGALLLGGAFALLVRIELFSPGQTIVGRTLTTSSSPCTAR